MGGIIEGSVGMFMAAEQQNAELRANELKFRRDTAAADLAIESARERGAWESGKARIMGEKLGREQMVAYANSGVDASSGTAAQVQGNTAALAEMDAQQLAINAAREVYGIREQKKQMKENRELEAENIKRKAIGQGLGSYSKALGGWLSFGGK